MSDNSRGLFRSQALTQGRARLHGDILLLPQFSHVLILSLIVVWVVLVGIWLMSGEYARKETVLGWLEPPEGVIRVYPLEAGSITQVFVEEGQNVKKGDALLLITNERVLESGYELQAVLHQEYAAQRANLERQLLRLDDTYQRKNSDLRKQAAAANAELLLISSQISTLSQRNDLYVAQVKKAKKLNAAGHIRLEEYDNKVTQQLAVKEELQSLQRAEINQQTLIDQLRSRLARLPNEKAGERDTIMNSISRLAQQVSELKSNQSYTLVAEKDGVISNLQVREGQRVNASGQSPLLSILPQDMQLTAQLLVPVRAIGFIEAGQALNIRYDAFAHQKFGLHPGQILHVSKTLLLPGEVLNAPVTVVEPVYRITASIEQNTVHAYGKAFALRSGMTLSADIALAERNIIEWLLEPILSVRGAL